MTFSAIGLFHPKSDINVGSALRAAYCYEASLVVLCGQRVVRAKTDTMGASYHIPVIRTDTPEDFHKSIPFGAVPVAVDLLEGATALQDYEHPKNAFYIFGPEDGTLGTKVTSWCRDTIYVPTRSCMNLAATVNVVLYDRKAKQLRKS